MLSPKVLIGWKRIDIEGEQHIRELSLNDNYLIKGNNLIALHCILPRYRGKVKLVYIDPPYNSGGEANIFSYNNNFNHSTWLTFIKNRLEAGRLLLRDDGFIAIAIDQNELFYLGVLADEIFGRENRIGLISVKHHPAGRTNDAFFATTNEYMLVYAKDKERANLGKFEMSEKTRKSYNLEDSRSKYKLENLMRTGATRNARRIDRPKQFYPIYVNKNLSEISLKKQKGFIKVLPIKDHTEWVWSYSPESLKIMIDNGDVVPQILRTSSKVSIKFKRRITNYPGRKPTTTWDESKYNANEHGTKLLNKIFGRNVFSYPKSLHTVSDAIRIMTSKNDIILDFFAGSGTTAHATILLNQQDGGNRKFILIEQLDEHVEVCRQRIQHVIKATKESASFVCCEIAKSNAVLVNRIKQTQSDEMLRILWRKIQTKNFLSYRVNKKTLNDSLDEYEKLSVDEKKHVLISMLDKNQLYVNFFEIYDEQHEICEVDKQINELFYSVDREAISFQF